NGSNQAAAVAVSGDAALANTGALSVTRIRGTSVNSTAPTASGQVLKYNGSTEYVATYFGVGDLKNSLGNAQFPASCTAAQTLVYSAVTDVYTCSSIAIANTAVSGLGTASTKNFGTSAGNLVELDGGGRIPASLIPTSASGDLSNGGNTTGATVVVGTNDAQSLQLETNNSVAMTILNGGNIGIGTASPGTKLHIAGSGAQLRIQDTANTTASNSLGGIISYRDSAGTEYGWVGDGSGSTNNMAMYSGIGSASLLTTGGSVNLTSAGNVGIGTTNPLRNLSVSGSSVSAGEHRVISAQTSNGNESISLGYDANGTVHTSAFIRTNNIRPLVLGTQTTPSAFTVLDGGNVGIGTTNPSAKLEVVGQIVSQESTLVSGATANFANGNSIVLQSVGGSAITVSNMVAGGTYNVVVEDTTSRTYTFTGCTTSYFSPANGPTINRSIYTIYRRGASSCYISWVTGFN
ncbi:MAG: hypothetical protein GW917_02030, partial [Bdellovibrionales bacterium]|nr:hypothetical protein [Bdellovibrionales bacterium]